MGPSSVSGRVRGKLANREFGGRLITTGGGSCIVGGEGEGHTRKGLMSSVLSRQTLAGGQIHNTLDIGGAGLVGYGIGGTGS